MYCARLYEREYAKKVVHDYQLMDKYFFSKDKPKRRLTPEERYYFGIMINKLILQIFSFLEV